MKLYVTFSKGDPAGTAVFWYLKADGAKHASDNGHEFYQYEVEGRRADIADWLNNTVLPDVFGSTSEQDQPSHDAQPPVDVDPETGEILDDPAQEPAGSHDDPDPPRTADEALGERVPGELTPAEAHDPEARQAEDDQVAKVSAEVHANLDQVKAEGEDPTASPDGPADEEPDIEDLL